MSEINREQCPEMDKLCTLSKERGEIKWCWKTRVRKQCPLWDKPLTDNELYELILTAVKEGKINRLRIFDNEGRKMTDVDMVTSVSQAKIYKGGWLKLWKK